MSSENLLQMIEETPAPAAAITEEALSEAGPESDAAEAAARPLSVQERRLQAARDINAKIGELEEDIARLTSTFGQSQEAVKTAVGELQNRSQEIMADVLRVSTRLELDGQQQKEQHAALDGRLTRCVTDLGRELGQANALLQAQKERLAELRDNHDTLSRLHEHLERLTARQGQTFDVFAVETRQQLQILRTHLDGLYALYREQQQALLALTSDHELLAIKSDETEKKLAGLSSVVVENMGRTRRRFRAVAGVIAALAMVSLGLIAYFQLYPSAVPETVKTQLAGLSAGLDHQEDSRQALRSDMEQLHDTLAHQLTDLTRQLRHQGRDVASLEAEAARTTAAIRRLEASLAALQQATSHNPALPAQPTPAP